MFPERVAMHRKKRGDYDHPMPAKIDRKGEKKTRETKNDFLLSLRPAYSSQWFPTVTIIQMKKPTFQNSVKKNCEKERNEIIMN